MKTRSLNNIFFAMSMFSTSSLSAAEPSDGLQDPIKYCDKISFDQRNIRVKPPQVSDNNTVQTTFIMSFRILESSQSGFVNADLSRGLIYLKSRNIASLKYNKYGDDWRITEISKTCPGFKSFSLLAKIEQHGPELSGLKLVQSVSLPNGRHLGLYNSSDNSTSQIYQWSSNNLNPEKLFSLKSRQSFISARGAIDAPIISINLLSAGSSEGWYEWRRLLWAFQTH